MNPWSIGREYMKKIRRATLVSIALLAAPAAAQSCGDDNWLYTYRATVTEVYDGDTITADVDLGFQIVMRGEKFRLYGVDAPEMRGPEREAGTVTRDWLRARILEREVTLKSIRDRKGKYGRWLALVCDDDGDVVADMIAAGLAVPAEY